MLRGLFSLSTICFIVGVSFGFSARAVQTQQTTHIKQDTSSSSENLSTSISKIFNFISSFNSDAPKALDPSPICKECAQLLKNNEQCTSKNNYLEKQIEKAKDNPIMSQILSIPDHDDTIRSECIQAGMETFSAGNAYRTCASGQLDARSSRHLDRPCISSDYLDVTSKSFNAAAECLSNYVSGSDSRMSRDRVSWAIYAMMNVESGFHTNAMSSTGAGGPGQFTQIAIQAVNQNMRGLIEHLSESSNPICNDTLVKALKPPMSDRPSRSCERISFDDNNPLRNMIYTFAYQAQMRRTVDNLFKGSAYSKIIAGLSPVDREDLLSGIATWSHNTGPGGMQTPLRALLWEYIQSGKKLKTTQDLGLFLVQLQKKMLTDPHPANSSQGRRDETFKYYSSIIRRAGDINDYLTGGTKKQGALKRCFNSSP